MSGFGKVFPTPPRYWVKASAPFNAPVPTPEPLLRLCIYYGWPSAKGYTFFLSYGIIVLGDGLEAQDHPDHAATKSIISALGLSPRQIFGYIDLGNPQSLSLAEVNTRIAQWKAIGCTGIFLDDAGDDYALLGIPMPGRRDAVLELIHVSSMVAMMNAWRPEDVANSAYEPGDWWLCESCDDLTTPERLAFAQIARHNGLKVAGIQVGKEGEVHPSFDLLDAFGWASDANYGSG